MCGTFKVRKKGYALSAKNISDNLFTHIEPISENIVWVVYTYEQDIPKESVLIAENFCRESDTAAKFCESIHNSLLFKNKRGEPVLKEIGHGMTKKEVYKYVIDGEPIIKYKQTANGEVAYVENARQEPAGTAYEGKLVFETAENERLYGLGQHEDGVYNYSGKTEYLYQTNMKISIPFIISSRNYGILLDTESAVIFDERKGKMTFALDTVNRLSYYVITGEGFDEIIMALRNLTGRTPMLPRWAFGYIQSKERYHSSAELLEVAAKFRNSGIPLDCIVQDWFTWEEGLWGEKRVDKERYPDLKSLVHALHNENVRLMISVWPNMAEGGSNYLKFKEKGLLLPNSTTYDAFDEKARAIYWSQCEEDWFAAGIDAWWCDNAEPFSDADWSGETKRGEELRYSLVMDESKKSMDWTRLNTYGLLHAKGIYENWRKSGCEKRVVNLTRSSYISGQRYGTVAWSGDISAKWSVLQRQITEGIKFSLSGMPYWTLDIGGFFTVKDKWENRGCGKAGDATPLWFWDGDYNDGVSDLGYRELYVRWLQYAVFLPMFRAHGTDTAREPWNFGESGERFYDAIIKFIKLRYRLLPYIYSMSAAVWRNHDTMIRGLMFDFAHDKNVLDICDSFMFGKAILVCPVTNPMYYEANGVPLIDADKTREVYLPESCCWFDYWTNKKYTGGQTIQCESPLDVIPLFIKAGSIIPVSEPVTYADQRYGEVSEILVYAGADGEFILYNDDGDNYSYENGNFSEIKLVYRDSDKTLFLGQARSKFNYQENFKVILICDGGSVSATDIKYAGKDMSVSLV